MQNKKVFRYAEYGASDKFFILSIIETNNISQQELVIAIL